MSEQTLEQKKVELINDLIACGYSYGRGMEIPS